MLLALVLAAVAQQPVDLDTTPSSFPVAGTEFRTLGSSNGQLAILARTYVSAQSSDQRRDLLLRTDGTAAGTTVVADLSIPGSNSTFTDPGPSATLPNGDIVCSYSGAATGNEPYLIEAATGAVRLVADVIAGPVGSEPRTIVAFGDEAWILADETDSQFGLELWRTDGTESGTQPVATPTPLDFSSELHASDSALYLIVGKSELLARSVGGDWVSLPVPSDATLFDGFGIVQDRLILSASTAATGREPWVADLATLTVAPLGDLWPGPSSSVFYAQSAISGDQLLFRAEQGGTGREPWVTDGTAAGTQLLLDVAPGAGDGYVGMFGSGIPGAGPIGTPDGFYFTAFQPGSGAELWFSDGTSVGTALVADLNPGPASSSPTRFLFAGGDLYLGATTGLPGSVRELYRHVPGSSQFDLVAAIDPATPLGVAGGALVWQRSTAPDGSLYRWDPASGVSAPIADPSPEATSASSSPGSFARLDFRVAMIAKRLGAEKLFVADAQASLISDEFVTPLPAPFGESKFLGESAGGPLFAENVLFGSDQLYVGSASGGTGSGSPVALAAGPTTCLIRNGAEIGGRVLFVATGPLDEAGIWSSDGTDAGTSRIAASTGFAFTFDIFGPGQYARFNGEIWFEYEGSLWRSDGVTATQATSSTQVSLPWDARVGRAGDALVFVAEGGSFAASQEVWSADGSTGELLLVMDPPGVTTEFRGFAEVGERALFAWRNFDDGQEVWVTDGTPAGTQLLIDATPGSDGRILDLVGDGVRAFFISEDPDTGIRRLWASDGTTAGTAVVNAGDPEVGGFAADRLWPIGLGRVGFAGFSSATGHEPWGSDGTTTGPLTDLVAGPTSSFPGEMIRVGDLLLVQALDPLLGREPFLAPLQPGAPSADALGLDCGATLRLASGLPNIGSTPTFALDELEPNASALLAVSVLFATTPLGGGCVQYADAPAFLGPQIADANGAALFDVDVPNVPSIVGLQLSLQGLGSKPGGPLFGAFELSHALEVVLGG